MLLQYKQIDYRLLADACRYYNNIEYNQIESPWIIEERFSLITSPNNERGVAYVLDNSQHLVCSSEQGMIQMAFNNTIRSGVKYFSVSPCFRDEPLTEFHSKTFMKLELFSISSTESGALAQASRFSSDASTFFKRYKVNHEIIPTDIGEDIVTLNGLELGSYGIRKFEDFYTVYGTGLALPRFSLAQGK